MYSSEMWQTVFLALFLVANAIISAAHRERIARNTKMPSMQFDIALTIDPSGKNAPSVIVRRSADAD